MFHFASPGIDLISNASRVAPSLLEQLYPGKQICACDFYVEGSEAGDPVPGGFRLGDRLEVIDHHAEVSRMMRFISSTNLGIERVRALGAVDSLTKVCITHTDYDSIASACVVRGIVPPEERFGVAAIAADHTGEANELADLLQSLEDMRDLELSLSTFQAYLEHQPIPQPAQEALQRRLDERERATRELRQVHLEDGIGWIFTGNKFDSAFMPSAVPEAKLLVQFSPLPLSKLQTKLRIGLAATPGSTLHALKVPQFDVAFGNRWNAGSNERGGGSEISIQDYLKFLKGALSQHWR